jgi:hypothetical protein
MNVVHVCCANLFLWPQFLSDSHQKFKNHAPRVVPSALHLQHASPRCSVLSQKFFLSHGGLNYIDHLPHGSLQASGKEWYWLHLRDIRTYIEIELIREAAKDELCSTWRKPPCPQTFITWNSGGFQAFQSSGIQSSLRPKLFNPEFRLTSPVCHHIMSMKGLAHSQH